MKYTILSKLCIILFLGILLVNLNPVKIYADTDSIDDVVQGGDSFIGAADKEYLSRDDMKGVSNMVYNVLLSLGIGIAVIIATVLGVQYMLAGAEGKAEINKSMIPFLIGCVVVFSAFAIWKAVVLALR